MKRSGSPFLLALALFCSASATAGVPLPPWQRAELSQLPADTCQELRIVRAGAGHLEIRWFSSSPLEAIGVDRKLEGASLWVAAADPERPSLVLYDESGPYARSARVPAPLRWIRRDGRLCVASGSAPVLCGTPSAAPTRLFQTAFGAGWQTDLAGCGEIAAAAPARFPFARLGPRVVAWGALLSAAVCFGSLAAPGRMRRPRLALSLLAALTSGILLAAPHPIATQVPEPPVVSPLFTDAAYWQPQAGHQSLSFRGRPISEITAGREAWLVLGGSVTYGAGVEAGQTFTAVAERILHEAGRPVDLYNAGAEGWNLHAIDRWLLDMGDSLPITGIVLASILNNATLPIPGARPPGCEASLLRAFVCNQQRSVFFLVWPKVFLPKPGNAKRHRRLLRALLARETALGRRVVLMDEPSGAQIHGGMFRFFGADSYRATTREVAAEFGLSLHPVADALAALPEDDAFLDGIHPTAAAHRLWGERLFELLRDRHRGT